MKIKVFVADDHKLFRDGLISLLKKSNEIEVIGEASSGQETIDKIVNLNPDVALIDITMPELSGIEVIKRIKKHLSKIKILVISMHADPFFVINAFKAGASGYMLKEDSFESLIDAIKVFIDFSILQDFGRILKLFMRCVVVRLAAAAPSVALPTPSHTTAIVTSPIVFTS